MYKKLICTIFFISLSFSAFAYNENQIFNYYAEGQELSEALSYFAQQQKLSSTFSPEVKGKLSGKFSNMKSKDFLMAMRSAFNVGWYEQAGVINFYNLNETKSALIGSRIISAKDLEKMLVSAKILSPHLPAEIISNGEMLSISGPEAYILSVKEAIASFEASKSSNFIMQVFPLKYAWANDISINSMDTKITIPGIATILKAMVSGSNLSSTNDTQLPNTVPPLLGQGLASVGKTQNTTENQAPTAEQNFAMPQNINIIADPRVNSVLITDAEYRMPYYAKVIADLDKPVELVEIHAAIVDIDSNFNRELGIDFQGSGSIGGNVNIGGSSGTAGATPPIQTPGTIGSSGLTLSTLYKSGADFFLSKIQALEDDNNARILGKPSVLTMDNVQATLENTSTYYIEVGGKDVADLFKVEAGTVLRVTPHIIVGENGTSSIKLVVNVQDDQGGDNTVAVGALPPIRQTKINTQAIVNEGQSLLIGGYYYEQAGEGESGVPFIKNVPVIGNLFKTQTSKTKKMERLILITPRIIRINDPYELPARIENSNFSRSASGADYSEQIPVVKAKKGGCAKSSPSPNIQ